MRQEFCPRSGLKLDPDLTPSRMAEEVENEDERNLKRGMGRVVADVQEKWFRLFAMSMLCHPGHVNCESDIMIL